MLNFEKLVTANPQVRMGVALQHPITASEWWQLCRNVAVGNAQPRSFGSCLM